MVEAQYALTIGQLVLTFGAVLAAIISWVRNGIVARKVREGIGLDRVSERLDEIKDKQDQTHEAVESLSNDVESTEKGLVAVAFALEHDEYRIEASEFSRRFADDGESSMFDFVDDTTRSPDGGHTPEDDPSPGDD